MSLADKYLRMVELGATPEMIATMLEAVEETGRSSEQSAYERRKAWDREYQAKRRAEQKSAESGGNRVDETTKEKAPIPPKENIPPSNINITPPPDRFDEWWEIYPLKKSKGRAKKAWKPAKAKTSEEFLIASLKTWVAKNVGTDPKYLPYPATWLNDEKWTDQDLRPALVVSPSRHSPQPGETREEYIRRCIAMNRA
jgi:hypothetical protein